MNILHTIAAFFKRFRYGATIDPVRDWLVALMVSGVLLVAIIAWNIWTFNAIAAGGIKNTPIPASPALFNRASLDALGTIFTNRAAEEAKYVAGVYRYADPSQ